MKRINIQLIILAGGVGKRMKQNNLPKVLIKFKGKPIISHLLGQVKKIPNLKKPVIVIGKKAGLVKKTLGDNYSYVFQKKQLGTGHAVMTCEKALKDKFENIMVLYGDHPLLTGKTIQNIINQHLKTQSVLTMAVVKTPDFKSWRSVFWYWGRIIRDNNRNIIEIIEYKDADEKTRQIKEVNPSFFCFDASWLWSRLHLLRNNNVQKEYYLTDLVHQTVLEKQKIATVNIDPQEAPGINTQEELNLLNEIT